MSVANQLLIAVASGLAAGGVHVFSGPDHLAAIAPLSLNPRGRGWITGVRWGFGHASGVLFVGLASLFLREMFFVDLISSWSERLVGVALLAIGLWGFRKAASTHVHVHEHSHGGQTHKHVHLHGHGHQPAHSHNGTHTHTHAAFAVGTLHGFAGSSHILGVLPALAFPTKVQATGYLLAYGIGTVLAMGFFSTAICFITRRASLGALNPCRWLMLSCSSFAVGLGAYWLMV